MLRFHNRKPVGRQTTANEMRMLGEVLRIRLREVLREDMGGVYGVFVRRMDFPGGPKQRHGFQISFGCAPENVEKLEAAVLGEIKAIQKNGIGDDYIAKVKNARVRQHELDLKENRYWSRRLTSAYRFGDDPRRILDFQKYVDKISSKRVRKAARKYLKKNQYLRAVLRPEKDAK